ncbi:hypothetical protein C8R47DRAFT_1133180 [Mycena vitilis]|nr:hypothetical protein C8R47DRAFT_1133180 [Mycena vitilis]
MGTVDIQSLTPLLSSNDPPYSVQSTLVQDVLRDKQAELFALGDVISGLELSLEILWDKHATLVAEIQQYTRVLSPVRRLPPEIVGEIFLYFTPSMHRDSDLLTGYRVKLPWKLGYICRLWRAIALNFGQLWSVVDLGSPFHQIEDIRVSQLSMWAWEDAEDERREDAFTESESQREHRYRENCEGYEIQTTLEFCEECLRRSGSHPLSLRLWMRDFAVSPLLDALLKHSARWRELVLVDPHPSLMARLNHFGGDLQGLRRIAFANYNDSALVFQQAPNLTELTFLGVGALSLEESLIPWSRLTRLCEMDCSMRESLESYRKLDALLELCLDIRDFPPTSAPIIFPNLRAASLRISTTANTKVVQCFEMPVLEHFSIEYPGPSHSNSSCGHAGLHYPTSSPHLKVLRIRARACYLHPGHHLFKLEHALKLFPNLTEITIDVHSLISQSDISRLTPDHTQLLLVPKLEIMRFSEKSFVNEDCQWRTLLEMLHARFEPTVAGVSPLRRFETSTEKWSVDTIVTRGLKPSEKPVWAGMLKPAQIWSNWGKSVLNRSTSRNDPIVEKIPRLRYF